MAYSNIGKGHPIGSYTNEAGVIFTVHESVTGLDVVLTGNVLDVTYVSEEEALGVKPPVDVYSIDLSSIIPSGAITAATDVNPTTGEITLTKGDGSTFTIKVDELTALAAGSGSNLLYTDERGVVNTIDISSLIQAGESITSLSFDGSGNLLFTDESGVVNTIDISGLSADCCIASASYNQSTGEVTFTKNDGSLLGPVKTESLTSLSFSGTSLSYIDEKGNTATYDLTTAVKQAESDTVISGNISNGHSIGIYTNEAGNNFDIQETITSIANFSLNAGNNQILLDYVKEDGTVQSEVIDLSTLAIDTIASIAVDTTTPGGPWLVITNSDGSTDSVLLSDVFQTINHTLSSSGNTLTSVVGGTTQTAPIVNSIAATIVSDALLQISVNGITSTSLDLTNAVKAAETNTTVTNTVAGNPIAQYNNEDGTSYTINETITSATDTNANANKHEIATYTNESGASVSIKETVTSLSATTDPTTGILTLVHVDELGNSNSINIDICALISTACAPATTTSTSTTSTTSTTTAAPTTTSTTTIASFSHVLNSYSTVSCEDACGSVTPTTSTTTAAATTTSTSTSTSTTTSTTKAPTTTSTTTVIPKAILDIVPQVIESGADAGKLRFQIFKVSGSVLDAITVTADVQRYSDTNCTNIITGYCSGSATIAAGASIANTPGLCAHSSVGGQSAKIVNMTVNGVPVTENNVFVTVGSNTYKITGYQVCGIMS